MAFPRLSHKLPDLREESWGPGSPGKMQMMELQILWEQPLVANLLATLWFRGSVFTSVGFSPDHPFASKEELL